ncbi:CHD5-like protein [Trichuris suis]|uniref:Uncharacterized protein n=1 Tax=Trichuris suis TaxID=68888 RepID=A0A085ME25_9BILA|nr:hypothetical protein M513_03523 [Trichuris suis]KHJ48310.1 CHD5-like protein [Trichuris suis]
MEVASLSVVLHVFGTLAAFYLSPYYISPITWLFSRLTVRRDKIEKKLHERLGEVKKELEQISMVQQFAEYSRRNRELHLLKARIKVAEDNYRLAMLDQRNLCTLILYAIMILAIVHCIYKYYGLPILQFPANWFAPFNFFLSFPGTRSTADTAYVSVSFLAGFTMCLTKLTTLDYLRL